MKEINTISPKDFYYRKNNYRKLTLGEGEKFIAKVAKVDLDNKTITLRTPQGREIECSIEGNVDLEAIENKVAKFFVKDVNEGKITVSILESLKEEYSLNDSIENLLSQFNSKDKGKDENIKDIVKLMLKFNIDINKENISQMKTLIDFKEKLMMPEYDVEKLINNILDKNNVDIQTPKGAEILNKLNVFFKELKGVDLKTLFAMKENNIPFTGENIASLKNINNDKININDIIKKTDDIIKKDVQISNFSNLSIDNEEVQSTKVTPKEQIKNHNTFIENELLHSNEKGKLVNNIIKLDETALNKGEKLVDNEIKVQNNNKEDNIEVDIENLKNNSKDINKLEENNHDNKKIIVTKEIVDEKIISSNDKDIKNLVYKELKENVENMKSTLEKFLQNKDSLSKDVLDKVSVFLESHMKDIKVYNAINNNYYYLDSPIKYNNEEYPCKLIIKDERKKDKKVDKNNVKIAISLKTKKIGVIDSFIKVNYNNMNIEFQCEEGTYALLNKKKQNLIEKLSKNNYFVNINIKKKVKEFGIIECMDFFQELNTAAINIKV